MRCLLVISVVLAAVGCDGGQTVEPDAPVELRCQGNEPFWNLTIEGGEARYAALNEFSSERTFTGELRADGLEWHGSETLNPENRLVARVLEETCLDTMSEETPPFSHSVRLELPGGQEVAGCCRSGAEPAPEPPGIDLDALPAADLNSEGPDAWSRFLIELFPAIDFCLEETTGSAPRVTKAWPMSGGMVGVRLRNGEGGWFHCVAVADGSGIDRLDLLDSGTEPVQGEGIIVFSPASGAPPSGNCYEHEQVLGDDGGRIGWLSYNRC